MRFKCDNPKTGDTRLVKTFLLFPRKINDNIVWLEYVLRKDVYKKYFHRTDRNYDFCLWETISYHLIKKD